MKKLFIAGLVSLTFVYGFTTLPPVDNCDKAAMSAGCKKKLDPFKYDSQKFTKVTFSKKVQQLEVEVPVFIGEKYRLIFNTSGLPRPIGINVYTKGKEFAKRETIYTNKSIKGNETEIVFDVPRVRKLFIDYDVPADSTGSVETGCLVFMVGYK